MAKKYRFTVEKNLDTDIATAYIYENGILVHSIDATKMDQAERLANQWIKQKLKQPE